MHKHYLLLITLLFIGAASHSQTYTFDYMVEYSFISFKDSLNKKAVNKTNTAYYFINTKDKAATLFVNEHKGTTYIQLILQTGKVFKSTLPTEDFFVEAISMKCPYSHFLPPADEKPKDFEFVSKADTVVNTQPFKHYVLNPVNKKKFEKGEIRITHFIIDNSLDLTMPIVMPESLSFKFLEKGTELPNGIIKESYYINALGQRIFEQKMVQILPIKKIIIIDNSKCK